MSNYDSLKNLADEILYTSGQDHLPVDAFSLAETLGLEAAPYSLLQEKAPFLQKTLAQLQPYTLFFAGWYTVYYDETAKNTNYLVMQGVAKYLLKQYHYPLSNGNISILTALLLAPPDVVHQLHQPAPWQLRRLCTLPPHKGMEYQHVLKHFRTGSTGKLYRQFQEYIKKSRIPLVYDKLNKYAYFLASTNRGFNFDTVYTVPHSRVYHKACCKQIAYDPDVYELRKDMAGKRKYSPCPHCVE